MPNAMTRNLEKPTHLYKLVVLAHQDPFPTKIPGWSWCWWRWRWWAHGWTRNAHRQAQLGPWYKRRQDNTEPFGAFMLHSCWDGRRWPWCWQGLRILCWARKSWQRGAGKSQAGLGTISAFSSQGDHVHGFMNHQLPSFVVYPGQFLRFGLGSPIPPSLLLNFHIPNCAAVLSIFGIQGADFLNGLTRHPSMPATVNAFAFINLKGGLLLVSLNLLKNIWFYYMLTTTGHHLTVHF